MRPARHFVEWHGEHYTVEPLKSMHRVTSLPPVLAVSRRGEFIGTLPYRADETPEDLEIRCVSWLRDLFEALGPYVPPPTPRRTFGTEI